MSDNASWFYGERLPEIAREHNCSLKEAERIFMQQDQPGLKNKEDKQESVEIDLPEKELFDLMLMAHEEDITFNQLVNKALKYQLKQAEYQFENGDKLKPQFLAETE
jgi:hypothetical protein